MILLPSNKLATMSISYDLAKLLIIFVNSAMTLESFLADSSEPHIVINTKPKPATDLTEREAAHENAHVAEWEKRGIHAKVFRDKNNYPYTEPSDVDLMNYIKTNKVTKEQFLNMFLDVVKAPMNFGFTLDGTDEVYYKILKKEIRSNEDLLNHRIKKAT